MASREDSRDHSQTVWTVEPGYTTVQFTVKNLFLFNVAGRFSDLAGTIVLDETDLRLSSAEVAIGAASIDTANKRRDKHLRSADFLDVGKYPEIRFQSTSVNKGTDRDTLRVVGTLTVRDNSREVALDVTQIDRSRSPQGEEIAYYTALAEIDRFDFGVRYMRGLIGRRVKVVIHVQARRLN